MGLFDFFKKALGMEEEGSRPRPSTPHAQGNIAPRPQAGRATAARKETGIPGWDGPVTDDAEAALEAHKLMSWVIHEAFNVPAYENAEFQSALTLLHERDALDDEVEVLKRAALKLRQHHPLWFRLAERYTAQYDNASARTIWQKLVDADYEAAEASFQLGVIAERDESMTEAAANYQRAVAYNPDHARAWTRAEALAGHLPMPTRSAAATLGGVDGAGRMGGLGVRAPEGYALKHPLGRGGYGTVYLANDTHLHRDVAIKFLHPHLTRDNRRVEAFFEEARLVARLSLPGVVRIYDLDQEKRVIVMEYLTRGTLRDRLSAGRALAPQAAIRVARSLLNTLGRLHRENILHRDLKPENILFRTDGSTVLGDFGVATLEDTSAQSRAAGTLAYMAPEQKQPTHDRPIDRRADLYAVGLILIEMIAGGLPVGAASQVHPPDLFLAMLPTRSRDLLATPLRRLLSVDPDERPAEAAQVSDTLRSLSRQFAAQDQVPALLEEIERLQKAADPQDHGAHDPFEAIRRALHQ